MARHGRNTDELIRMYSHRTCVSGFEKKSVNKYELSSLVYRFQEADCMLYPVWKIVLKISLSLS